MSRGKRTPDQNEKRRQFTTDLIVGLASNPEVYKGSAQDAAKLPMLASQIMAELLVYVDETVDSLTDETNQNGL